MGYLTTITIYNDAQHKFKQYPMEFGQSILNGIDQAQLECREVSVPFRGYGNYISVQPPRHADDTTVYVHCGNAVMNMNPWGKEFQAMVSTCPDYVRKSIKIAEDMIKEAKRKLKESQKNQKVS